MTMRVLVFMVVMGRDNSTGVPPNGSSYRFSFLRANGMFPLSAFCLSL